MTSNEFGNRINKTNRKKKKKMGAKFFAEGNGML